GWAARRATVLPARRAPSVGRRSAHLFPSRVQVERRPTRSCASSTPDQDHTNRIAEASAGLPSQAGAGWFVRRALEPSAHRYRALSSRRHHSSSIRRLVLASKTILTACRAAYGAV